MWLILVGVLGAAAAAIFGTLDLLNRPRRMAASGPGRSTESAADQDRMPGGMERNLGAAKMAPNAGRERGPGPAENLRGLKVRDGQRGGTAKATFARSQPAQVPAPDRQNIDQDQDDQRRQSSPSDPRSILDPKGRRPTLSSTVLSHRVSRCEARCNRI